MTVALLRDTVSLFVTAGFRVQLAYEQNLVVPVRRSQHVREFGLKFFFQVEAYMGRT